MSIYEHIVLWNYLFMMRTDELLCVTFHVQHNSDSGGHDKQLNILELGKKKKDFMIFTYSHLHEPISNIKSQ